MPTNSLSASQIVDLANGTLADLGRFKMEDLMSDLQEFPAAHELMQKARQEKADGLAIRWNALTSTGTNGKFTGLHGRDNIDITAGELYQEIPWRYYKNGMAFDRREVKINGGASKIFDVVKARRHRMYAEGVEDMESTFWDGPTGSTDTTTPFGLLNYWLDYSATTGFEGGDHSYHAGGVGGKLCADYPRLEHYTFNFSTINQATIRLIRGALRQTRFHGIVQAQKQQISPYANGFRRAIYTTYDNLQAMEELLEAKNDNHGNDLAKYDGMVHIAKVPVIDVPYLSENHATSDPFIGIDWEQVKVCYMKGEWFRETPFTIKSEQHNDLEMHTDCQFNIKVIQRRKGIWLGAKSDPLSD